MNNKATGRFGGALTEALENVAASAAGSISVADAGTREDFLDGWANTLSAHARDLRSSNITLKAPIIIAHVTDAGKFGKQHSWQRRNTLGSSHLDQLAGILAVGSAPVGGYAHPLQLASMQEFEKELYAAGLEKAPTIALTSESKMFIWPDGIDSEEAAFIRELDNQLATIDLEAIDQHLDRFYEDIGRQTKKWWKDPKLRTTVFQPEATVQYDLWVSLMSRYSEIARIKMEDVSGNGRADITITPTRKNSGDQSAVLELKTLRDVRTPTKADATPIKISQKDNIEWACSGIQQTAAYRDREKLEGAFLCLYDFCAGNSTTIYDEVTPHAITYKILHRRYWITASHEEHRKDRYPLENT